MFEKYYSLNVFESPYFFYVIAGISLVYITRRSLEHQHSNAHSIITKYLTRASGSNIVTGVTRGVNDLSKTSFDVLRNLAFCRPPAASEKCKNFDCNAAGMKNKKGVGNEIIKEEEDPYVVSLTPVFEREARVEFS